MSVSSKIRFLDDHLVSQIAAGEVVERPASILKELIENAMDAGATDIKVHWRKGGTSVVRVEDNGCGMTKEDVCLSIQRHATSKLSDNTLCSIGTFGFRGEALASIASVARVTIKSCIAGASHGWNALFESGELVRIEPCSMSVGTVVEVRDLFYATPARLKFMRTAASEHRHMVDVFDYFCLAHCTIRFVGQWDDAKEKERSGGLDQRIHHFFGASFLKESFHVDDDHLGYRLSGRMGLPSCHRSMANRQVLFVNGRWVKDRGCFAAIRRAFGDTIPHGRHAVGVLFLTIPLDDVDVNVHPAKTEVRFLDSRFVHTVIETVLKKSIMQHGVQYPSIALHGADMHDTAPAHDLHDALCPVQESNDMPQVPSFLSGSLSALPLNDTPNDGMCMAAEDYGCSSYPGPMDGVPDTGHRASMAQNALGLYGDSGSVPNFPDSTDVADPSVDSVQAPDTGAPAHDTPLGYAIGQVHDAYIVAANHDGLVLVDPHAAHERIVYEKMKTQWADSLGNVQPFLLKHSFTVSAKTYDHLRAIAPIMTRIGFSYELGDNFTCHLLSIPVIFAPYDGQHLLEDLADHVQCDDDPHRVVITWRDHMMANWACRKSLRLGQKMSLHEMNQLLRTIEKTPNSASCNHGRCAYRTVSMQELARFFDR